MGSARWSPSDWTSYATATSTKATHEIFRSSGMDPDLDPLQFKVRESRDSEMNPKSTPIILAVDVTGSMGILADNLVKKGLGVIMKEIYERKPIVDPHILCAAIGDVTVDRAPFQATQFEAGVEALTKQVEKMYIEHGGGGNYGESYNAAWYFAANRTACDAIVKRGRKGYLFTIGDEPPLDDLSKEHVKRFFGDDVQTDMTSAGLLDVVNQNWETFHLRVKEYPGARVKWKNLMGERCIDVSDVDKLSEIIVSTIQLVEGASLSDVVDSWSGDTSVVVRDAVMNITRSATLGQSGVVRL